MKITMELSSSSIGKAIKELEAYREALQAKVKLFVLLLAEGGIEVAENLAEMAVDVGAGGDAQESYGSYIYFSKEVEMEDGHTTALVYGVNKGTLIRSWYSHGTIKSAEVNPLLMAEFGSGVYAKSSDAIEGVGRGTFPGQTHAFQDEGWKWIPEGEKEWHWSNGVQPTSPMYHAAKYMKLDIARAAKEAFGDG